MERLLKLNIKLFGILILLVSCQKKPAFTYHEWNSKQGSSKINLPENLLLDETKLSITYKQKKIEYKRQLLNGKPIYNSFLKKVSSPNDEELFQANLVDKNALSTSSFTNKEKIISKKIDYLEEIKKQGPEFEKSKLISAEEIVVIEKNKAIDYTLVNYFTSYGVPYSSFFKIDGTLARTKRQGSQFSDINATIYTEGPKLSQLSEQIIKGLSAQPTLSNSLVFVTSESDKKINSINSVLKFDLKDDRFDQLQVFYYLNKSFQWMKDQLQVQIPIKIEAVVHVGFPEKTNSAFYFQNKIRLGRGDDVTYSNIMHDASIVYHESFHALIDQLAHLPYEGEGGSLNEGFADFFTCLITERPFLGESSYLMGPFKRSLQIMRRLDEKNEGLYHDSQIFSSLLWEIKEKISFDKAKTLAVETLIQLNEISTFSDFNAKILIAANEVLSKEEIVTFQQILKSRGFHYE